jgi:4-hydroxy-tetrahydrodipicolinate synthase
MLRNGLSCVQNDVVRGELSRAMGMTMIKSPIFAILTPFDAEGQIAEASLKDYMQFLHDCGVRAIVVGGTTGEFPSLDFEERVKLFRIARKYFTGTVINNVSSCSFREAHQLARLSEGADALLILPPYYFNGISEGGIVAFIRNVMEGVTLPAYLYHFPRHTKVAFTGNLVKRIRTSCPRIVGIKDSAGIFETSLEFHAIGDGFRVFVGSDSSTLKALKAGLAGSVTGASNPFPEYLVALTKEWGKGRTDEATAIQETLDKWSRFHAQLDANEIAVAKFALSLRLPGFPTAVRPPLVALSDKQERQIQAFFYSTAKGLESLKKLCE